MNLEDDELTIEQMELLYLISKITDSNNCPTNWVKETPLQAMMFYAIRKGIFNEYDYAPISSSFLGQGRKFVNISKEGEDDLGDLREMGFLETIRLSSSKHDFITGYRSSLKSKKLIELLPNEVKERIDHIFICPKCKAENFALNIEVDKSEFKMVCNQCNHDEFIPLIIPEDVSYKTKAYFFENLDNKNMEDEL
ncbi:MAG: hypothetical protein EAX90_05285 [Candidatus Heimdallarchaeota archaeon]|nr:hypothetical protein [Candidatus Heimdallarchaeota archaeon]